MERAFDREARILKQLDGKVTPKLLSAGVLRDCKYVAIEWCDGVPATVAAQKLRRLQGGGRQELHRLCHAVLESYSYLHGQKIIHSDVHPRNVLVDPMGAVRLIDFGLSRIEDAQAESEEPQRGGVGSFFEPEFAIARLRHRHPPSSTVLGEQYALAVLLYFLIIGAHYLDFSAEKTEMRRQIAEDTPLPFAPRADSWPEAEALLRRALSKSPADRFTSVSDFAKLWGEIAVPGTQDNGAGIVTRRDAAPQCQ